MAWTEADYFATDVISSSGPFDDQRQHSCRFCGYTFTQQYCGQQRAGMTRPEDAVRVRMHDHLLQWHREKILMGNEGPA